MLEKEAVIFLINSFWLLLFLFLAVSLLKYKIGQIQRGQAKLPSFLAALPLVIYFGALTLYETARLDFAALVLSTSAADIFQAAGGFILLFGTAIFVHSRLLLAESWAIEATPPRIVQEGLYSKIRHPMYLGIILAMFGTTLVALNWLFIATAPFIAAAYYFKARDEERTLALVFPEYREYMKRTRMFVPGVF